MTKLQRLYFNYAYNPVYDFTTACLNGYQKLQEICIGKLELEGNDKVLCVGLGTGNEILRILKANRDVRIIGVDYSHTALEKAYKKASTFGKEIETLIMDARNLEFPQEEFDKVLCIHVMDFIPENEKATSEILRVLKPGGKFVITYASQKEGLSLGTSLLNDFFRHGIGSRKYRIIAFLESLPRMLLGVIYLPLLFRSKRKSYLRSDIEKMIAQLNGVDLQIEEDPVYQDFIVNGRKES